jgi:hypothetical protein
MPSAQDVLDAVEQTKAAVNNNTIVIGQKLDTLTAAVNAVDADVKLTQQVLLWGFEQLITLGQYANQALSQNDKQNDTMICILEQIAVNTCGIWNEAHIQTHLEKGIETSTQKLARLYAATHGDAAVAFAREEELLRRIEKCCPPEEPPPVCVETPCPTPPPFNQSPPATQPPPPIGPIIQIQSPPATQPPHQQATPSAIQPPQQQATAPVAPPPRQATLSATRPPRK